MMCDAVYANCVPKKIKDPIFECFEENLKLKTFYKLLRSSKPRPNQTPRPNNICLCERSRASVEYRERKENELRCKRELLLLQCMCASMEPIKAKLRNAKSKAEACNLKDRVLKQCLYSAIDMLLKTKQKAAAQKRRCVVREPKIQFNSIIEKNKEKEKEKEKEKAKELQEIKKICRYYARIAAREYQQKQPKEQPPKEQPPIEKKNRSCMPNKKKKKSNSSPQSSGNEEGDDNIDSLHRSKEGSLKSAGSKRSSRNSSESLKSKEPSDKQLQKCVSKCKAENEKNKSKRKKNAEKQVEACIAKCNVKSGESVQKNRKNRSRGGGGALTQRASNTANLISSRIMRSSTSQLIPKLEKFHLQCEFESSKKNEKDKMKLKRSRSYKSDASDENSCPPPAGRGQKNLSQKSSSRIRECLHKCKTKCRLGGKKKKLKQCGSWSDSSCGSVEHQSRCRLKKETATSSRKVESNAPNPLLGGCDYPSSWDKMETLAVEINESKVKGSASTDTMNSTRFRGRWFFRGKDTLVQQNFLPTKSSLKTPRNVKVTDISKRLRFNARTDSPKSRPNRQFIHSDELSTDDNDCVWSFKKRRTIHSEAPTSSEQLVRPKSPDAVDEFLISSDDRPISLSDRVMQEFKNHLRRNRQKGGETTDTDRESGTKRSCCFRRKSAECNCADGDLATAAESQAAQESLAEEGNVKRNSSGCCCCARKSAAQKAAEEGNVKRNSSGYCCCYACKSNAQKAADSEDIAQGILSDISLTKVYKDLLVMLRPDLLEDNNKEADAKPKLQKTAKKEKKPKIAKVKCKKSRETEPKMYLYLLPSTNAPTRRSLGRRPRRPSKQQQNRIDIKNCVLQTTVRGGVSSKQQQNRIDDKNCISQTTERSVGSSKQQQQNRKNIDNCISHTTVRGGMPVYPITSKIGHRGNVRVNYLDKARWTCLKNRLKVPKMPAPLPEDFVLDTRVSKTDLETERSRKLKREQQLQNWRDETRNKMNNRLKVPKIPASSPEDFILDTRVSKTDLETERSRKLRREQQLQNWHEEIRNKTNKTKTEADQSGKVYYVCKPVKTEYDCGIPGTQTFSCTCTKHPPKGARVWQEIDSRCLVKCEQDCCCPPSDATPAFDAEPANLNANDEPRPSRASFSAAHLQRKSMENSKTDGESDWAMTSEKPEQLKLKSTLKNGRTSLASSEGKRAGSTSSVRIVTTERKSGGAKTPTDSDRGSNVRLVVENKRCKEMPPCQCDCAACREATIKIQADRQKLLWMQQQNRKSKSMDDSCSLCKNFCCPFSRIEKTFVAYQFEEAEDKNPQKPKNGRTSTRKAREKSASRSRSRSQSRSRSRSSNRSHTQSAEDECVYLSTSSPPPQLCCFRTTQQQNQSDSYFTEDFFMVCNKEGLTAQKDDCDNGNDSDVKSSCICTPTSPFDISSTLNPVRDSAYLRPKCTNSSDSLDMVCKRACLYLWTPKDNDNKKGEGEKLCTSDGSIIQVVKVKSNELGFLTSNRQFGGCNSEGDKPNIATDYQPMEKEQLSTTSMKNVKQHVFCYIVKCKEFEEIEELSSQQTNSEEKAKKLMVTDFQPQLAQSKTSPSMDPFKIKICETMRPIEGHCNLKRLTRKSSLKSSTSRFKEISKR